jgi:hypothetical protein
MTEITGRDDHRIDAALAYAYAANKFAPVLSQQPSNAADWRALLFARRGRAAETILGDAMLRAWFANRPDVAPAVGHSYADYQDQLRRIRDQVTQDVQDADSLLLLRHIDALLGPERAA